MPVHEPIPVKVDRITARVISTLSPARRNDVVKKLTDFRRYTSGTSVTVSLDGIDLAHPQADGVTIKATHKKVETMVRLKGAIIRNGRQVIITQDLPETILVSLKKKRANDVIDTDLLEGHTITYARERDIHLKDEDWVPIAEIDATGEDLQPITNKQFIDGIEALGITHIDAVMLRYMNRVRNNLHILLKRIEAHATGDKAVSASTRINDLAEWDGDKLRASFWIQDNKLMFSIQVENGGTSYRNGYMSCYSAKVSYTAEKIRYMCLHMPRVSGSHSRKTKTPYRTIEQVRESYEKSTYW